MQSKFYYINESAVPLLQVLFNAKDPELKLVLHEFGDYADVATYAPKYGTVVFTTVKASTIKDRL